MNTAAGNQAQEIHVRPAWLLPLILMKGMFSRSWRWRARLKEQRRARCLPLAWRAHYERLQMVEWHIHQLLANGARQLLKTGKLDLRAIPMFVEVDDDDFLCPMPASAYAMSLRLDITVRFHADPERYIRRMRSASRGTPNALLPIRSMICANLRHLWTTQLALRAASRPPGRSASRPRPSQSPEKNAHLQPLQPRCSQQRQRGRTPSA